MDDQSKIKTIAERIEDALREIGTLIITFAPLDYVLRDKNSDSNLTLELILLLGEGAFLFILSLLLERKRSSVR